MELLLGIVVGGAAVWLFKPLLQLVWTMILNKKDDDDSTS